MAGKTGKAPMRTPGELDDVLAGIRKEHGDDAIMLLGENPIGPVEAIPTGSVALDEALGVGGLPRGRIVEIYGPESSGKTSITLHAVANAQRMGLIAAFVDAEHALDPAWAASLGVDTDKLAVSQPDNAEQALNIVEALARSGKVGIIVVDSVSALVPKAELEGAVGDYHVGLQARIMSQALRKLAGVAYETKTTVAFINQLREKVGVFYGNPETTSGGKALKFYASVRLDVRKVESLKDGSAIIGNKLRVKVVKNKVAPPFRQAEVEFFFEGGFSAESELIELAVLRGVLIKAGSHYAFEDKQVGHGKDKTRQALRDDPALRERLEKATRAAIGTVVAVPKTTSLGLGGTAPWDEGESGE
jgi:recombination protein RecA